MTPSAVPAVCPGRDEWLALVDDRLPEPQRSRLLDHLQSCAGCSATLASVAGQWSIAAVAARRHDRPGVATRELAERVAAGDPPVRVPEGIVPTALPAIPGFRDLVPVARGGMGLVCRATDVVLERTVAVKLLPGWRAATPAALERARREALVLARIDHPGVVRVFSSGDVDGVPWIAMEWIDGPTLSRRLAGAPLPPREAARIARELARAVARVHAEGIVHRDIKPDNILLAEATTADDAPVPKLVDFGLARRDDAGATITQAVGALGTPSFMAPEQTGLDPALGPVGPATDVHGLGATLYCMLTGRAPYHAATTAEALALAAAAEAPSLALLAPGVPADLRTIVGACLRRLPGSRYRSASALADDLSRYLDGLPVSARPVGRGERLLKWARRHPGRAAVAVAALVIAVGAAAGVAYHVRRLEAANTAALASAALARQSFQRLTDDTAERLLVRNATLDDEDRDHLLAIRDEYQHWPLEPEVAATLRFRIAGLRRVAMIFSRLERAEEMVATITLTLAEIDELERRGLAGPDDEILRYELHRGIRAHRALQGGGDDVLAATADDIARLEARVAVEPALRPALAATLGERAARLDSRGEVDEAGRLFLRALGLFDEIARERGKTRVPAHLEMSTRFNASTSRAFGRDPQVREELTRRLVERGREILADPAVGGEDRSAAERGVLLGLRVLAEWALGNGDPAAALDHVGQLDAELRSSMARDPGNHALIDEFVSAASDAFRCHGALGRPERAVPAFDEAVTMAERALAAEPASFQRARSLARALDMAAGCLVAVGERERAAAAQERVVAAMAPWVDSPAVGAEARLFTAGALEKLAKELEALNRPTDASAALERARGFAPGGR